MRKLFTFGLGKLLLPLLLIFSIVANTASLVSAQFHDRLYGLLAALPIHHLLSNSPSQRREKLVQSNRQLKKSLHSEKQARQGLIKQQKLSRAKVKTLSQRVVKRTVRTTARNIAQIPAESIPYVGAGVVIAATALDVKDACDTLNDLDEMMLVAGIEKEQNSGTIQTLCDPARLAFTSVENHSSVASAGASNLETSLEDTFEATQAHYNKLQKELIRHVEQAEQQFRNEWSTMLHGIGLKLIELSNTEEFHIEDYR